MKSMVGLLLGQTTPKRLSSLLGRSYLKREGRNPLLRAISP